ncbi:MAG: ferredoxin family protein [Candidatus Marinimicrobia bacterium]|nr:ferredoxin family protein [Candidatus Neomarinimicrobiota bacterium]MCF7828128.1 ferredoxin family protein [Candidatus Neomarinimicrobiota bacterium]MCF7879697.1 ferredoxin family protein [Candidatus Neomarinimicrobiota bacterium]
MTYVIGSPCVAVCDTSCVEVCPVDCIYAPIPIDEIHEKQIESGTPVGEQVEKLQGIQLYIHPDECIDCAACEPECPVDAIRAEGASHEEYNVEKYLQINIDFFEEGNDAYNSTGKY